MLASIIVILLLLQLAILALVGLYRRKIEYREVNACANDSPAAPAPQRTASSGTGEPSAQATCWEGFRDFRVQRRVVEDRKGSICSFYLAPVDGRPLPGFMPGQFLTFRLTIEDPLTGQPKMLTRCYSLSDSPRSDCYRVSIKRVPSPAGQPGVPPGLSSSHFHDQVQQGSILRVKAPSGHFHLMEDEPLPIVLVGGGIGITPMLSIVNSLLERGSQRQIWLYYGVRNGSEAIMQEHLRTLDRRHENFHLHLCYSNPGEDERAFVDYQHKGRVDIPLLRNTLQLMRYKFYVCGPRPMMESLVPGLEAWGVDARDIYYESFGPASLFGQQKPKPGKTMKSVAVNFRRSGKRIGWSPNAGSLLELAEENGIAVESGCRAGSCGGCQTLLESGEVEYLQQPDAEIESGHCLLCISTPKGDITLAA